MKVRTIVRRGFPCLLGNLDVAVAVAAGPLAAPPSLAQLTAAFNSSTALNQTLSITGRFLIMEEILQQNRG